MERIEVVDGPTLAAVLKRIGSGVVLTIGGNDVAVLVRPEDLTGAATAYLLEALNVDLSALLASLPATPAK